MPLLSIIEVDSDMGTIKDLFPEMVKETEMICTVELGTMFDDCIPAPYIPKSKKAAYLSLRVEPEHASKARVHMKRVRSVF